MKFVVTITQDEDGMFIAVSVDHRLCQSGEDG